MAATPKPVSKYPSAHRAVVQSSVYNYIKLKDIGAADVDD